MTNEQTPAVLASDDAETMAALKSVLSDAVGRARIELGAGDPTSVPSVSVLPPRPVSPDDRSPVMPDVFDLVLRGDTCFAVHRESGKAHALEGVTCLPAPSGN